MEVSVRFLLSCDQSPTEPLICDDDNDGRDRVYLELDLRPAADEFIGSDGEIGFRKHLDAPK